MADRFRDNGSSAAFVSEIPSVMYPKYTPSQSPRQRCTRPVLTKTVIFVPTEREAEFFAAHGLGAQICGVGMAECAAAVALVLAARKPDLAILAGVAGTYTDYLRVGDTVVVRSETVADLGRREPDGGFVPLFQKTYTASFIPDGFPAVHSNTVNTAGGIVTVGSGNGSSTETRKSTAGRCGKVEGDNGHGELAGTASGAERNEAAAIENMEGGGNGHCGLAGTALGAERNEAAAAIENMEGASFFAVCGRFGVPAMEVRTISNRVGELITSEGLDLAARRLSADLAKIIEYL